MELPLAEPVVPFFALVRVRRYERESVSFGELSLALLKADRLSGVRFSETRRCGDSIWATGRGGDRGFWSSDGSTTLGCNSIDL